MTSVRSGSVIPLLLQTGQRATLAVLCRRKRSQFQRGNLMRNLLLILGALALLIGLLWIGQGTGYVAWPQSSFMINQIQWAWYGAALALAGLVLIWRGKR
jgi:hypothetical protein